jgi:hypothetical protein
MAMAMSLPISYARRIFAVITLCYKTDVVYLGLPNMRFHEVRLRRHFLPVICTSLILSLVYKDTKFGRLCCYKTLLKRQLLLTAPFSVIHLKRGFPLGIL